MRKPNLFPAARIVAALLAAGLFVAAGGTALVASGSEPEVEIDITFFPVDVEDVLEVVLKDDATVLRHQGRDLGIFAVPQSRVRITEAPAPVVPERPELVSRFELTGEAGFVYEATNLAGGESLQLGTSRRRGGEHDTQLTLSFDGRSAQADVFGLLLVVLEDPRDTLLPMRESLAQSPFALAALEDFARRLRAAGDAKLIPDYRKMATAWILALRELVQPNILLPYRVLATTVICQCSCGCTIEASCGGGPGVIIKMEAGEKKTLACSDGSPVSVTIPKK